MTDPLEQDVPTAEAATPDAADWRMVIDHECPVCGLHPGRIAPEDIGATLRATIPRWTAVLARPDVAVRPAADEWSPLEYACHVRDVCAVYGARLALVLRTDDPIFEAWDQNLAALDGQYALQAPADVVAELASAAESAASAFDAVSGEAWERPGRAVTGATFTVRTLGQYVVHELRHHLHDVSG